MRERAREFAKITNPHDGKKDYITILGFELRELIVTYENELDTKWGKDE